MRSTVKNMIQYSGLAEELPDLLCTNGFKKLNVEDTFQISLTSPPIKQIIKAMAQIEFTGTGIQNTQSAVSTGGQILTGKKLLIEGMVRVAIQYIASLPTNSVQLEYFSRPFSTYIILNKDFETGYPVASKHFIQDIYVKPVSERDVYCNINVLLTA